MKHGPYCIPPDEVGAPGMCCCDGSDETIAAMNSTYKTPGQIAYEADCAVEPNYHTGTPRATWNELTDFARDSWERNPTRRAIAMERTS